MPELPCLASFARAEKMEILLYIRQILFTCQRFGIRLLTGVSFCFFP